MENKTNQALLAEIQTHKSLFHRFALKTCRREEIAEDVIQDVICKLLRTEINFEVADNRKFIFTMIVQMNQNQWRRNKKYFQVLDVGIANPDFDENVFMDNLMQKHQGCTFQADMEYSLKLKSIRKELASLPDMQKHAIKQALAGRTVGEELGTDFASENPRYESLKTNKRLAIQKLKLKLA